MGSALNRADVVERVAVFGEHELRAARDGRIRVADDDLGEHTRLDELALERLLLDLRDRAAEHTAQRARSADARGTRPPCGS